MDHAIADKPMVIIRHGIQRVGSRTKIATVEFFWQFSSNLEVLYGDFFGDGCIVTFQGRG